MTATEKWAPVTGHGNRYEVSSLGRVRNENGRILTPQLTNSGYPVVHLYPGGGKHLRRIATIHRLVAKAFVPNPDGKDEVNHKNGVKADNREENVEWATRLENVRHSIVSGLIPPDKKMVAVVGVPVLGVGLVAFPSFKDAEILLSGKVTNAISHSLKRSFGTAYGYSWYCVAEDCLDIFT